MKNLIVACLFPLMITPAMAQEVTLMLGSTGMCHRDIDCSAVILTEFDTGRLMINVAHENGAVAFAGNANVEKPEDGVLAIDVDTIRFGKGDGSGDVYDVTGKCVATFIKDYKIWRRLFCSVFNDNNDNFVILFEGDGSPIKRQLWLRSSASGLCRTLWLNPDEFRAVLMTSAKFMDGTRWEMK